MEVFDVSGRPFDGNGKRSKRRRFGKGWVSFGAMVTSIAQKKCVFEENMPHGGQSLFHHRFEGTYQLALDRSQDDESTPLENQNLATDFQPKMRAGEGCEPKGGS